MIASRRSISGIYAFFGLPSKIDRSEGYNIISPTTEQEQKQIEKYNLKIKCLGYLGIALVILGFVFQLLDGF